MPISLTDLAGSPYAPTAADASLQAGPITALATQKIKPGFWSKGGDSHRWAGILSDVLAGAQGKPGTYAQTLADNQDRELDRLIKQTQLAKLQHPDPQGVNLGDGGYATYDPIGGLNILREPTVTPHQTPLQENLATLRQLRPDMTDADASKIVERGISGYQYDPSVIQQRQQNAVDLANLRSANAASVKAAPSFTNMHPKAGGSGGVTPTARARYISDAEAAIAKGAPRAAVYARLAKMGIQ